MKYISILMLFMGFAVQAQTLTKEEITGKWKTVKVEAVLKMPAKDLQEMQKMFNNSTFEFQSTGISKISLPGGDREFKEMLANNLWRFDARKKEIQIGTKADNYTIMGIVAKKTGNKIYFELLESGIRLEVKKI